MIVRVELDENNSFVTPVYESGDAGGSDPSGGLGDSGQADALASLVDSVKFKLSAAVLPGYDYSRYAHPAVNIDVTVPDDDMGVVASWLGSASASAGTPSDTFVKRMTSAVTDAIEGFYRNASRRSLFTRPFHVGIALRYEDGYMQKVGQPMLLTPDTMAPLMVIRETALSGYSLHTVTEIMTSPMTLSASIGKFEAEMLPRLYSVALGREVAAAELVIYCSRQAEVLTGEERVSGIRTVEVFGEHVKAWSYNRLAEDLVLQSARNDDKFKVLAVVRISEASKGIERLALPPEALDLDDWKNMEDFTPSSSLPGEGGGGAGDPVRKKIETSPLDLYRPEEYKRVRGLTLRGVFPREVS